MTKSNRTLRTHSVAKGQNRELFSVALLIMLLSFWCLQKKFCKLQDSSIEVMVQFGTSPQAALLILTFLFSLLNIFYRFYCVDTFNDASTGNQDGIFRSF